MGRAKGPLAILVVQARTPKPRPLLCCHDADPSSRSKKIAKKFYITQDTIASMQTEVDQKEALSHFAPSIDLCLRHCEEAEQKPPPSSLLKS